MLSWISGFRGSADCTLIIRTWVGAAVPAPAQPPAIVARDLRKSFGKVEALRGLSLEVPTGRIVVILGPNGAGKTTLVRVLATLLRPDGGQAAVAGLDVVKDARALRAVIGLAGQYAAVDEHLTGRENLLLVARLYHVPKARATLDAARLLHEVGLDDAADRPTKGYSGGMRRRLDLAAALIGDPQVLFLDEPTTGLDPPSRLTMWAMIEALRGRGKTIVLTTQYLEEADQLADQIVVIDLGKVIARGTADELKTQVGGERLELTVARGGDLDAAMQTLRSYSQGEIVVNDFDRQIIVPVAQGAQILAAVVRDLDSAHVKVDDLALRRPTLDDVFLALTGHATTTDDLATDRKSVV